MNLTMDFRTQSDYGTIRAYAAIIAQQSSGDFGPTGAAVATGSAGILRAFIQFAGFTVGHAVSYFDFMNGADYGYLPSVWSAGTGVNGTDLIGYTWQIGNGFTASIDLEDGGNGQNSVLLGNGQPGTGRGKFLVNSSVANSFTNVNMVNDSMRAMQPDLAGNLRVDQAWGSAQIMAALHNDSAGYYTNVPGALSGTVVPGAQVFGHPGELWGWAVGGGAKFVNFLLPRDMIGVPGQLLPWCLRVLQHPRPVHAELDVWSRQYVGDRLCLRWHLQQRRPDPADRQRSATRLATSTTGTSSGGRPSSVVRPTTRSTAMRPASSAARLLGHSRSLDCMARSSRPLVWLVVRRST